MKPNPTMLRLCDVATRCSVSLRTVHAWVAAGRLRVYRFGPRCTRVDPADLEAFLRIARNGRRP